MEIYHGFGNKQESITFLILESGKSSSIKIFSAILNAIFLKNSTLWNLSTIQNSIFPNSSTKKVVDPYIFPKQQYIHIYIYIYFHEQWQKTFWPNYISLNTLQIFYLNSHNERDVRKRIIYFLKFYVLSEQCLISVSNPLLFFTIYWECPRLLKSLA